MRKGWVAVLAIAAGLGGCAQPLASLGDPNLDAGRDVYRRVCASCHGGSGQGESGPALAEVIATFPECDDQQMWITLGTSRWKDEVGPSFGATNKPVTRVMPSFERVLSAEEIAQVSAYERFSFGGSTAEDVIADCGLA